MNIHNCDQGSPEWLALRAGIPTASQFDKIVTPTGKLSKSSRDYKAWLLAERVMGRPITTKQTAAMIRGTEFEAEAVGFYEGVREIKTELIGFVTNDSNTIGASPDRRAGLDRGLEIKVPEPQTQLAYFLAQCGLDRYAEQFEKIQAALNAGAAPFLVPKNLEDEYKESVANSLEAEYRIQTNGQVWVTGWSSTDLLSYSPEGLPAVFVNVRRGLPFMDTLAQAVSEFSRDLEESAADLVAKGIIQEVRP